MREGRVRSDLPRCRIRVLSLPTGPVRRITRVVAHTLQYDSPDTAQRHYVLSPRVPRCWLPSNP